MEPRRPPSRLLVEVSRRPISGARALSATWTPTSIASPSGIAALGNHLSVACLRGRGLYRLDLDGRNPRKLLQECGRLRTVAVAPDGSLWVTTSNRDQVGREDRRPQLPEGDRILRITPS